MKILIVKNRINYPIDDDINKFKDWIKRKTPLNVEWKEISTDIEVKLTPNLSALVSPGGIGYLEMKKILPPLFAPNKYHIVIFLYHTNTQMILAARSLGLPINTSVCIEMPCWPALEQSDQIYKILSHEIIHSFWTLASLKGLPNNDTMDMYDPLNEIRNLIMLSPYWSKIDEPPKKKYKWFSDKEIVGLKPELVEKLDEARELAGVPFIINSGYRTNDNNERVGGVAESSHLTGLAVDLKVSDGNKRFKILKGLLDAGFTRLGIYEKHIHADISLDKPQEVMWYV